MTTRKSPKASSAPKFRAKHMRLFLLKFGSGIFADIEHERQSARERQAVGINIDAVPEDEPVVVVLDSSKNLDGKRTAAVAVAEAAAISAAAASEAPAVGTRGGVPPRGAAASASLAASPPAASQGGEAEKGSVVFIDDDLSLGYDDDDDGEGGRFDSENFN